MKTYSPMDDKFRDSIGTVDADGKRKFLNPKRITGYWMKRRTWVAMGLLVFFFAIPWIEIGGKPFLLLDVLGRKFVIFGSTFWPQDSYLLVLAMISGVLFVVLFTVVYGRIFCGWICPQTIFMEHVFRRIEYWIDGDRGQQIRLRKLPWTSWEKIWKRLLKNTLFWGISFLIGNTFLMILIGTDRWWIMVEQGPTQHWGNFISLVIFTTVFYLVFAWFREQVCLMVCPYGRLQGAMIDRKSIVIAYDKVRGEPRGKFKKNEDREEAGKGDCIDCNQCVDVCPTGIDIRNGTQLECINCTACIDACDVIMDKIEKPRGLIRFASEEEITSGEKWKFTTRAKAYTAVLGILLIVMGFLVSERPIAEVKLFRAKGQLFTHDKATGEVQNVLKYTIINKANETLDLDIELVEPEGTVVYIGAEPDSIAVGSFVEGILLVKIPASELVTDRDKVHFQFKINGEVLDDQDFTFLGPRK
ncbi:cytochrome c oxidase accessory protein CcoG [Phaeocystidibacter marisrubri]|uniref:Cytochrome c oxidase accessory protein CcoG n=1 Tax=Phaeocystidibacter marisrubri TaxID=1577780 RepID=A0A6L3ZCU5_9FLAO|nr:cytochrome c oxidase accessory protein CcoG [Phaeocystidibacter marisrubri]KAB2815267.1 cytochrome c oxidase accessory protein CcoG [Phaeocystidibacter marisrubri]GGH71212.1 cytochrome c oxidase accessory protein CcoG [Phaeocystidibacter marisrubri]